MLQGSFNALDTLIRSHVDSGRLAGAMACVADSEGVRHLVMEGVKDRESRRPLSRDAIFRIFSMTKPMTGVAVMMLRDEGRFALDDPIANFIPAFAKLWILDDNGKRRRAEGRITIRHLLTHTAGLTLPLSYEGPLPELYKENGLEGMRSAGTMEEVIGRLASMPVSFEPGTRWQYSMAQEVLGRLVEVTSGQSFDSFLQNRLFDPLGMADTGFHVPEDKRHRFCSVYPAPDQGRNPPIDRWDDSRFLQPPDFPSGGGGLVSTLDDYLAFARMLAEGGKGLLSPDTIAEMRSNHLPEGRDMAGMGVTEFSGDTWAGIGFGLTMSVIVDPQLAGSRGPAGEYGWSGAAGTFFFNSPELDATAILLTQYMPSKAYPIRRAFRNAVYEGLGL
ncbi:MAG: serine hydrolase domain-containing protein [Minwuia sp.]|uniref:serine hydrolase domain-containing protein n=1 Tax=Minwuia sp. TaxID=2493630 RepID=UPI003A89446E